MALSGAHSIGNDDSKGMDATPQVRAACGARRLPCLGQALGARRAAVASHRPSSPPSPQIMDSEYFKLVQRKGAEFKSDNWLYANGSPTKAVVDRFATNLTTFRTTFVNTYIKASTNGGAGAGAGAGPAGLACNDALAAPA